MARVSRPDQEKVEEDPTVVQPQDPAVAQSLGAAGPASAPGGKSSEAPAAPAARSHFNDLSRLLYANQGQGARMAQSAVQKADTAAAGVNRQLGDAQSRFTQAAQAAVPKAVTPATPPPVVQGSGGLTGRSPTLPVFRGDMNQYVREMQAYSNPPTTPRSTTRLNSDTAIDAGAQQVANATYQGPRSLAETPGVNIQDLQLGFNRAGQQYGALNRNPSQMTGGAGRFNDFLIGSGGAGEIQAAQRRFQGLRDRFNGAVGDTATAAAAEAATKKTAADAQRMIDEGAGERARAETARQQQENDENLAAQAEDDYFHEYRQMNPTLSEAEARRYYDSNTDHIKQIIDNNRRAQAGG